MKEVYALLNVSSETVFFKCPGNELNRITDLLMNMPLPDSEELHSINKFWFVALCVLC